MSFTIEVGLICKREDDSGQHATMPVRQGMADAKLKQAVDDIINLLSWADNAGKLKKFPRNILDCQDQFLGDIWMILNKMDLALDGIRTDNYYALRYAMAEVLFLQCSATQQVRGNYALHSWTIFWRN